MREKIIACGKVGISQLYDPGPASTYCAEIIGVEDIITTNTNKDTRHNVNLVNPL